MDPQKRASVVFQKCGQWRLVWLSVEMCGAQGLGALTFSEELILSPAQVPISCSRERDDEGRNQPRWTARGQAGLCSLWMAVQTEDQGLDPSLAPQALRSAEFP